ncbi:hypothetical protein DX130_14345 [Paenibacillus paeoniae]|uniref:Uncharacterized protein n=1 Tax=Paenibacillus paeoniae TaxID=2292705 RepID=A0A371PFU5_9BACL|nr:hypothetical protein DX130_14345 [Paenibacillus paeoniae]
MVYGADRGSRYSASHILDEAAKLVREFVMKRRPYYLTEHELTFIILALTVLPTIFYIVQLIHSVGILVMLFHQIREEL